MSKKHDGGLVYSTDQGRMCPQCRHPQEQCSCGREQRPLGDGVVRVSRETKGRKGKGVTLISGIPLAEKELKSYTKELKAKCSTGGNPERRHCRNSGRPAGHFGAVADAKRLGGKAFRWLTRLINKQPSTIND